jgi:hypothetical protein
MWMGMMVADTRNRLDTGETPAAMLSACRMQAARSMLVFKQQLEEYVWTGYRHTQLIYDIAAAGAKTPQEAELIQALRPTFSQLPEDVLHAWVEANVDIAPRLGVSQVDESLLKALAKYHLSLFERGRQENQLATENRSRTWANRIAGAAVGATIVGIVVAIFAAA